VFDCVRDPDLDRRVGYALTGRGIIGHTSHRDAHQKKM
jgi:hypothetical protein